MVDIFENTILCGKCGKKMEKQQIAKNGFLFRAVVCPNEKCKEKIVHPADQKEYEKFIDLKNKEFRVKMRQVGNSYAVSIPKEIVSFMSEQEKVMDEMVKLCFEDFGRLSLDFNNGRNSVEHENSRVIKSREYKVVKNGKPIIHSRQFYDSADPKNSKSFIIKKSREEHE